MEAGHVFNYTMYPPNSTNTSTDIYEITKLTSVSSTSSTVYTHTAGRAIIGLSIILTNIALVIFYKYKSKKADITFLILGNLTGSDILLGVILLLRSLWILITSRYQIEACRLLFSVGGAVSSLMSAWCIFLLSYQVCIH